MGVRYSVMKFLGENPSHVTYDRFSLEKKPHLDDFRDFVVDLFEDKIQPFYKNIDLDPRTSIFNFLLEPLKNGNFYSENDKPIDMELWLSPNALLASYCDGGTYFTRPDVKKYWEDKKFHPDKFEHESKETGYGIGTTIIYELADLIKVDTKTGTLYQGLSTEGICFRELKS